MLLICVVDLLRVLQRHVLYRSESPIVCQSDFVILNMLVLSKLHGYPPAQWTHPYPRPSWEPDVSDARQIAAWNLGMACKPFERCSSMAKRMPHMTDLQLLHGMMTVHFVHGGEKRNFQMLSANTWLVPRRHVMCSL